MRRHPALFAILVGGGIAGAFDITYAVVYSSFRGVEAMRVLQSVASGLLGSAAFEGGAPIAALGFVLHFMLSFLWATIFFVASRWFPVMVRRAVPCGLAFGLLVYLSMTFVVLPLSAYPLKITFSPDRVALNLFVHMVLFGLSIALATRAASSGKSAVTPVPLRISATAGR